MHVGYLILNVTFPLLSCSDWDTASHFCGGVLPINGFLLGLSKMRISLDWTGWVRVNPISSNTF